MKEAPFIHSLFVSYGKEVPREERIPYTVGEKLTSEVLSRLAEHIRSGWAQSVQLEDETMENSLAADFREGWATIYIVKDTHHYYELLNRGFLDDETPLHITGDGPTPKKHATENIPLVAEAIVHFARTGQPLPACGWEESSH